MLLVQLDFTIGGFNQEVDSKRKKGNIKIFETSDHVNRINIPFNRSIVLFMEKTKRDNIKEGINHSGEVELGTKLGSIKMKKAGDESGYKYYIGDPSDSNNISGKSQIEKINKLIDISTFKAKQYEESKLGKLTAREKRTLNYFYKNPTEGKLYLGSVIYFV